MTLLSRFQSKESEAAVQGASWVVIVSLSRDKGAALGGIWAVSAPAEVPPKSRRNGAALRNRKKKRPENDTDFRTAFGPEIAPKSLLK